MNPEEDPEARIRQLEQPLAGYAVELGATESAGGANPTVQLPPPVYTDPYQQSPYTAPPFGVSYPQIPKKGPPIGLIFGLIAAVVVFVFVAVGTVVWTMVADTDIVSTVPTYDPGDRDSGVAGPTRIAPTAAPTDEPGRQVAVAPAGGQYSVSGVEEDETIECNGSNINVSGVNNTVTLLGHCLSVTVSGVENQVTVDSADRIGASGFDNQVTYRSGTPQVDASAGTGNVVAQG
ncbi:DUF3060 domain-containing protein [Mycobacterium sp. IDR2000157661]|uniref:DUF3060 domain-containing protein n=1 Tax=Mycobacterium sp. IDR2000157661 TaxID=2867005 RepID=UPI001EEAAFC7|nr:DUF3060 domain-containing protein [Mycobacterium sp. IDR2000157661]ULE33987.1 DUF3060 domain-containing protein [Mycobacterium sp. IDR2000157661]